jgi:hypothetical protein
LTNQHLVIYSPEHITLPVVVVAEVVKLEIQLTVYLKADQAA